MARTISFLLNDRRVDTDAPAGSVVLDFVRGERRLMGTKIGCREGDCGACTVLVGHLDGDRVDYRQVTSCLMPLGNAHGRHVVTVEGLNPPAGLNPVQRAMVEHGGTQCGFCTVGFVVSLAGFCLSRYPPTPTEAIAAIDGNICRCTGYKPIERAALEVAESLAEAPRGAGRLAWLVEAGYVPEYFAGVPERLAALAGNGDGGERRPTLAGQVVGGGTDLFVQRPESLVGTALELVAARGGLSGIRRDGDSIVVGGATTFQELRDSPLLAEALPGLPAHLKLVASSPIRWMATVAGNLVNASPIGDVTILMLGLGASVTLAGPSGRRSVPLAELYVGYKQLAREADELVESVSFKAPGPATRFNFEKVSKRTHLDIASVNSAARFEVDGDAIVSASLAAGGVGPVPLSLAATSKRLAGAPVSAETARRAARWADQEIAPISDARGSAEYKRLLLRQLVWAHFVTLFPDRVRLEALL